MFHSTLTRILAIAFVLVLGTIVRATPISVAPLTEIGTAESNVTCATQLINEGSNVSSKLRSLEESLKDENKAGTDPSETLNNITTLLQDSAMRMQNFPMCAGDLACEMTRHAGPELMHVYQIIHFEINALFETRWDDGELENSVNANLAKIGQALTYWNREW
ncbi:hypothetical protein RSOLAG22IIIB_08015 [Rhizoctonia solani]|uniref:Uncharacterized protein n=1 Tax=Rhizoctonia solani TaxID=456999 RepID=A0A0K6FRB1_9AGAM|nr:hypothetical protein RSOLAG22IIIB_08015 [Rhizoctonia solani]